jgi:hypothetical protein
VRIVAAAIRLKGVVFTGPHHATIISDIVRMGFAERVGEGSEQGFVGDDNQFYDRETSLVIAKEAGQIIFPLHSPTTELFSEMMWRVPSHWLPVQG